MEGLLSRVSWLWAFQQDSFLFGFPLPFIPVVLCDRCDHLLYRDVPWNLLQNWKLVVGKEWLVKRTSHAKARRASINPLHAVHSGSAVGWSIHGCVNIPCWNKDHRTHKDIHTCSLLWLGAAVLHVARSGLLRNAEQNHKWTRHTARQHKSQLAGSCSLFLCLSTSVGFPLLGFFFLSLSCFHSSVNTRPLRTPLFLIYFVKST